MSNRVPRVTGEEAVKAFAKCGYVCDRIKGSHYILKHPNRAARLSIPVHRGQTVGLGLLASQIKVAGLTIQEFCDLL